MKPIVGYEDYFVSEDGDIYSFKNNKIKKLKPANVKGYLKVQLCKNGKRKPFFVHRLVYMVLVGNILEDRDVDHIDRDRTNNKKNNLRLVTRQENNFNTNAKGYSWNKARKKWQAFIGLNNKLIYLGLFDTEEEARAAYLAAKEKYHIMGSTLMRSGHKSESHPFQL